LTFSSSFGVNARNRAGIMLASVRPSSDSSSARVSCAATESNVSPLRSATIAPVMIFVKRAMSTGLPERSCASRLSITPVSTRSHSSRTYFGVNRSTSLRRSSLCGGPFWLVSDAGPTTWLSSTVLGSEFVFGKRSSSSSISRTATAPLIP
jgi:hypothetical protein